MTNVDIDPELYNRVKELTDKNGVDFPNIKFFANQAIKEKLEGLENVDNS